MHSHWVNTGEILCLDRALSGSETAVQGLLNCRFGSKFGETWKKKSLFPQLQIELTQFLKCYTKVHVFRALPEEIDCFLPLTKMEIVKD